MTNHFKRRPAHLSILLPGSPSAAWSQPIWVRVLCAAGQCACFAAAGLSLLPELLLGRWDSLWKAGAGTALLFLLRLCIRYVRCPFCHRFFQWQRIHHHLRRPSFTVLRCRRCGCICKAREPFCPKAVLFPCHKSEKT